MVNNNFGKEFQQKHTGDFDMKSLTKSVLSVLLVLTLIIASFVPAYAASGDSTTLYNEGQRDEICTSFDNTTAPDYYTGSYTYDNLSTLSASSLKSSLNTLMSSTHKYTSSYDDCHYLADHTDCQNGDGSVSLIYTNYSATMSQWNGWNREHVWPKSLGGDTTTGGGADLHHIRPSDAVVNSTRSNNKYGNADGGKEVYGKNPATGYLGGYYANGYFEPLDNVKGDVARICLYVYVRWGSSWGATDITDVFQSVEVLLAWCELDPVDTWEMERNDVVEDIQGNRNVFIDYPEYAWLLFNETIPDDMITPSGEAMGGNTSGGSTTCTHTNKTTTTVDATCTTAGSVTVKCADCGSVVSKTTVAATGHTYDNGVCSVCGDGSTVSPPSTDGEGIEFTFGDNGTASHVDGSEISGSKTYTSGAYELTITSPSKVYHSAFDAQGNSALKFGTGSYVGSMTFTVPNDVTSVQIYAAKYKENTSYIVINDGTPQSLTSNSNDGQYDVITVDTSTQKIVKVATGSSGKRMMIDKIVYVIPSTDTPDTPSCEHTNKTTSVVGATCTTAGSETVTCDDCGEEISTTPIPATGHQNTTETTVEATCTTAGSVKLICDECGYVVSQSEIAALGHSYGIDGKCSICGLVSGSGDVESGETVEGEVTLTFDDTSKRTTFTTSQQIWEENGITLTNNKSSTSNVADYANPARFYKSSSLIVEYPAMTKIVFSCNTTEYASALKSSIAADSNYTVSISGKNVTVVFAESVDNFTVASLSGGQVRMDSLTVFYGASAEIPECEHTNTTTTTVEASCTVAGSTTVTCDDCGEEISTTPIPATGHQNTTETTVDATCTEAGSRTVTCDDCGVTISEEEIAALGHSYSDGVCTVCGNEQSSSSGAEEITATVIIADYADANGWANGTKYLTINADANIIITASGGAYTGSYYTSGENWRIYQSESPSLTITAGNGCKILSVTVTYTAANTGVLTLNGVNVDSGTAVDVNSESITFSVGNTGSATNGQARITAIDIVYEQPAACEHINTTETTVDATCTTEGSVTVTCDDCKEIISVTVLPELGHSYNAEGVCTVCNDTIPVASFSVPLGATAIDDVLGTLVTMPDAPVLPNIDYNREYTFVGWATAEQDNVSVKPTVYAPGDSVEINTDTAFFAVYSYSEVTTTTTSGWLKKDIGQISKTDVVVITMSNSSGVYAMSNNNGTSSAPSAVKVTVSGNSLSGTVEDTIKWNIETDSSGKYIIHPNGNSAAWLYSTNKNNGVRVGTNTSKTFEIKSVDNNKYLYHIGQGRYVGVYNNSDWRGYTPIPSNSQSNIKNQSLSFYVFSNETTETEEIYFTTSLEFDSGFTGASLNVAADLSLRYHALLENGGDGYTVRFTMDGKEVVVNGVADGGKFVFSFCGIAPQCMGDTIKAELLYNGEVIDVIEEYSVKQYVISALALHSTDTELCRLLSDMLYYGAAAQKYVSYKTDALVTDGVAGILSALDTVPSDSDKNRSLVTEDGADTSVEFIAAGVRFDYNNRIYVKLTTADITNVTVTVGGAELEIISLGNNTYIAYSDGISALDFDVEISFELRRGGTLIQTLTYTVNTYAWDKQDNDKIGELALALYRYGESAKEYAN